MKDKKGFRLGWEMSQSASKEEAEIMIYSQIVSEKWFDDEVTASGFDKALKEAKKSGANRLRLRINSPGGDVWQAVAMKTMVETAGFQELNVDIEGVCASAATFFVCIEGARVRIANGSEFMIHNPASMARGTASDFQKTAERLKKMEEEQHGWYAARTGQTEEQIKAWMDETTWFTAKEAIEAGFCDEMIQAEPVAACASKETLELMQNIYGSVPAEIGEKEAEGQKQKVRNVGTGVAAGTATEYQHHEESETMEIKEITEEQLREGNPELHRTILQMGMEQERARIRDIEALTTEGFEELAREAKEKGTSCAEFLRQVVAEQTKKKKAFLTSRGKETAPANQVTGGAETDNDQKNSKEELDRFAKEMAEIAKDVSKQRGSSMY